MNRRIKQIIASVILVVTLATLGWFVYDLLTFRVVSSSPNLNQSTIPASAASIRISFNRPLDESKISLANIDDKTLVREVRVKDKSIILVISDIQIDRTYSLEISNIASKDGKVISKLTYSFRAVYVPAGELSDELKQQNLDETDRPTGSPTIREVLPHETASYRISYGVDASGWDIVYIDMKFSNRANSPTQQQSYLQNVKANRNEALRFLKDQGFTLKEFSIEYGEDVLLKDFPKGGTQEEQTLGDGPRP